jgi:hypothetical protein
MDNTQKFNRVCTIKKVVRATKNGRKNLSYLLVRTRRISIGKCEVYGVNG